MGLHGAGLTSAVFSPPGVILVELRTLYGYDTDIFTRVADSRNGTYVHIDAREYSVVRTVNNADERLALRIVNGILAAQNYQRSNEYRRIVKISATYEDYIVGPALMSGDLSNIMGPKSSALLDTCRTRLPYAKYRGEVLMGDEMQYCTSCNSKF